MKIIIDYCFELYIYKKYFLTNIFYTIFYACNIIFRQRIFNRSPLAICGYATGAMWNLKIINNVNIHKLLKNTIFNPITTHPSSIFSSFPRHQLNKPYRINYRRRNSPQKNNSKLFILNLAYFYTKNNCMVD